MSWQERITVNPDILAGKPTIKGTRLAVEFLVELCAAGWTLEDIVSNYPSVSREDVLAALQYATEVLKLERIYPIPEHA